MWIISCTKGKLYISPSCWSKYLVKCVNLFWMESTENTSEWIHHHKNCTMIKFPFLNSKDEICLHFRNSIASLLEVCRRSASTGNITTVAGKLPEGRMANKRCSTQERRHIQVKYWAELGRLQRARLTLQQMCRATQKLSRGTETHSLQLWNTCSQPV